MSKGRVTGSVQSRALCLTTDGWQVNIDQKIADLVSQSLECVSHNASALLLVHPQTEGPSVTMLVFTECTEVGVFRRSAVEDNQRVEKQCECVQDLIQLC